MHLSSLFGIRQAPLAPAATALVGAPLPDAPAGAGHRLYDAASGAVATCRSTGYQHHSEVDAARGVYRVDCSGLVDHLLALVDRRALGEIPVHPRAGRSLAADYERHFAHLPPGGAGRWIPVRGADDLTPGDVLAWLVAADSTSHDTGHVMIVASVPRVDPNRPDVRLLEVIDSTGHGHGHDTRPAGAGGLGRGTIGLAVDEHGHPTAVLWRGDRSTVAKPHRIAAGRLRD